MSRKRFGAGAVLAAVLLAGCAAAGEFVVDNGSFRVEFVDPNDPQLGCRFLRAGWIRSLHPAGSRESIFVTESLFGFHPAFGYACEIYPALDLKGLQALQIGVGVIERHPQSRYHSRPVELFPWQISREMRERETVMTARQYSGDHSGYAYELTVEIVIPANSPVILWKYSLANTGSRSFAVSTYAHPFFKARPGFPGGWYALPGGKRQPVAALPPEKTLEATEIPQDCRAIAAGGLTSGGYVAVISADRPFSRIDLWRSETDCFAVEPYLPLNLAPGECREWSWRLEIRR